MRGLSRRSTSRRGTSYPRKTQLAPAHYARRRLESRVFILCEGLVAAAHPAVAPLTPESPASASVLCPLGGTYPGVSILRGGLVAAAHPANAPLTRESPSQRQRPMPPEAHTRERPSCAGGLVAAPHHVRAPLPRCAQHHKKRAPLCLRGLCDSMLRAKPANQPTYRGRPFSRLRWQAGLMPCLRA